MHTTDQVSLSKLTRREFSERMQSGSLRACIIPVGAIEQHAEHLAMEHDWRSVTHVAEAVATRLRPAVLVAPALMAGISEHHMKHPGTLTLSPGTFLSVLKDIIDSVARAGFENILVLNGHGGNVKPCEAVWDQYLRTFQRNLHFLSYWDVLGQQDADELLRAGRRVPEDLPGHAREFETSIALAAFPDNVRPEHAVDHGAKAADAESGRAFLERITDRLVDYVQDMIDGRRSVAVPPFHP